MSVVRLPYIFVVLFFSWLNVNAQQKPNPVSGNISGRIVDVKNEPVAYATVTLLKKDSSVVNGDLSADDGSFKVTSTGTGIFMLRVQSMGLLTRYLSVQVTADTPNRKLGKIKLS